MIFKLSSRFKLNKIAVLKSPVMIFLYYLIIALVWTYPLILNLRSSIIGLGDAWFFVWNFWWAKTAIVNLHTHPFYTYFIHWPNGISMFPQTITLFNSLISIPLQYLLGLVATYNILILFSFAMTGYGVYLLALYLSKNKFASFIAGYLVTFSPYHIAQSLGHLNLASTEWIPFYLLYLIKMTKGERGWFWPAFFLVLIALSDLYYLFYMVIFTCFYLLFNYFTQKKSITNRNFLKNLFLMTLFSALALTPYLGPMIVLLLFNKDWHVPGHDPVFFSSDLLSFFIPSSISYFKDYFSNFWIKWTGFWEVNNYIGYSILALIFYAIFKIKNKMTIFWSLSALLFAVLSLGPYLHLNGEIIKIALPYFYMDKYLPFMSIQGVPTRMVSMMYISIAILVALSIAYLIKKRSLAKIILLIILLPLFVVEYAPTKLIMTPVQVPIFYSNVLQKDHRDYAIIDVSDEGAKVLYYQTIHHKRLIGGYVARYNISNLNFLQTTPVISDFYFQDTPTSPNSNKEMLAKYNIKYILIENDDTRRKAVAETLGLLTIFSDDKMIAYQVY